MSNIYSSAKGYSGVLRSRIGATFESETQVWQDKALCHGVPDDYYMQGPASELPLKQKFIEDYCEVCPVAQQCLDEGLKNDDMDYTVRGGYLPLLQTTAPGKGRPRGFSLLLSRGECMSGRHKILSMDDIRVRHDGKNECLGCEMDRNRGKIAKRVSPWEGKRDGDLCPGNLHVLTESGVQQRRCHKCNYAKRVEQEKRVS